MEDLGPRQFKAINKVLDARPIDIKKVLFAIVMSIVWVGLLSAGPVMVTYGTITKDQNEADNLKSVGSLFIIASILVSAYVIYEKGAYLRFF